MCIIDGRKIAEDVLSGLKKRPTPRMKLVAVLSGDNSASLSFLRQKEKVALELGVLFELRQLPVSLSQEELELAVSDISSDDTVGGIIVQLPLPQKYNREKILSCIDAKKDVDALRGGNERVLPPAVLSLKYILEEINFELTGKKVVVVGHGFLIGRPIVKWLKTKDCEVSIIEEDYFDVELLKKADLVISGTGKSNLVNSSHLKNGVVAVDYGYGVVDGKVCGDIDFDSVSKIASFITPTPKGTGPVVVASLFVNFYELQIL